MRRLALIAAALLLAGGAALPAQDWQWRLPAWLPPPPVPADNPMSAAKVDLGRRLFFDARLSADGTRACASCHDPARAFTDGRRVSIGIDGTTGRRNAPSLANAGYLPVLTWANPLQESLERHALIPLFGTEPVEMGSSGREQEVFARLAADPVYPPLFSAAFPAGEGRIGLATITRALAAFQRSLVSASAPWDRYRYGGERDALSPAARRGEALFFGERLECYHCHGGFNFTDSVVTVRSRMVERAFHDTGLYAEPPPGSEGIAAFTLRPEDVGRFRTPSLRNVAVTAPYMHDGSVATLEEAIALYAQGGRHPEAPGKAPLVAGFRISPAETADLVAFLESLTDAEFLSDPAHQDPWPAGHPARADRPLP